VFLLCIAVSLGLVLCSVPGTTTASALTFAYDAPARTRVDTRGFSAAEVGLPQLSGPKEQSASPLAESRGASTTPREVLPQTRRPRPLDGRGRAPSAGLRSDSLVALVAAGSGQSSLLVSGVGGVDLITLGDLQPVGAMNNPIAVSNGGSVLLATSDDAGIVIWEIDLPAA